MKKNARRRKKGEGSIYQRSSDGRWAATLTKDDGTKKTIYGDTPEEVVDALARARNQQLDHIPFTDERLTVAHWLTTWLRNTKPPATAPKTWITYEGFVRLHRIPKLGHIRLKKLQHQDVRDFLGERLDAGYGER